MKDDALILAAWERATRENVSAILATVVKVSGSSYRGPGARMLITQDGSRIGSISGGCLESDVVKKAWWLTAETGATLRIYDNTSDEDAVWTFGLGCNGVVHVLIERLESGAAPLVMDVLRATQNATSGAVLATVLSGAEIGHRAGMLPDGSTRTEIRCASLARQIQDQALSVWEMRKSGVACFDGIEVFLEYVAPPVRLLIVGAGHDAVPAVRFAKELGWHVTVLDGRSNYARPERFPEADRVLTVDLAQPLAGLPLDCQTAAVVMSHSYEQDSVFLRELSRHRIAYLGALGPRKRTERMLAEAGELSVEPQLHSPIGLDIGADTPEEIALAIVSEIQAVLKARPAGMLRDRSGPIHERSQDRLEHVTS